MEVQVVCRLDVKLHAHGVVGGCHGQHLWRAGGQYVMCNQHSGMYVHLGRSGQSAIAAGSEQKEIVSTGESPACTAHLPDVHRQLASNVLHRRLQAAQACTQVRTAQVSLGKKCRWGRCDASLQLAAAAALPCTCVDSRHHLRISSPSATASGPVDR